MRLRYLTVASFLAAALSQEISILQLVPLGICYALFAQRMRWPDDVRLTVAGGCALALIVLDIVFAQVRSLTALDGISPNVEATLGWTFHAPSNFFSLLIGYSRLHRTRPCWKRVRLITTCGFRFFMILLCATMGYSSIAMQALKSSAKLQTSNGPLGH